MRVIACSAVVIDDALGGGRGNVDVVDADAGASDHLEAFRPFQDLRRDLGRGTDRETVEIPDDLGELLLVASELRLKIDLDAAILENLHRGGRESIGDKDFGGHGGNLCS
jgi:hypothetical protein